MKRRMGIVMALLAFVLCTTAAMASTVPQLMNYQGRLNDNAGAPVNGPKTLVFSLYSSATATTALWTETQTVTVNYGVFNAVLGTTTLIPTSVFDNAEVWLGIAISTDAEMTPRLRITSVGYAMRAAVADSVSAGAISGAMIAAGSITPDKLASTCNTGETLIKTASGWMCGVAGSAPCAAGDFMSCYSGLPGTKDVGVCKAGIRTCLADGSGFGPCVGAVLPSPEVCDGKDNDCNGIVDDSATDATTWYRDADGDGFGDPNNRIVSCGTPTGYVDNSLDCGDDNPFNHPPKINGALGGVEICDGVDNDCNGQVDDNCVNTACSVPVMNNINLCLKTYGLVPQLYNCVQASASGQCLSAINALATCMNSPCPMSGISADDVCLRQQCSAQWLSAFGPFPPECVDGQTRACGSNVGECRQGTQTCVSSHWGNCEGGVGPVPEICGDGKDNNCDGQIDENMLTWSPDADGDGYGNPDPNLIISACTKPLGYVAAGEEPDCDDANPNIHPGALEICDGKDNNCDGLVDEVFNIKIDSNNCGGCGNVCSSGPHAAPSCDGGICQTGCQAGWADCDNNPANGCETDLGSANSCGVCGNVCSFTNGTASCVGGTCQIACNAGWANCDGNAANGCEANLLSSVSNCGVCGNVCSSTNGAPSCVGGTCQIAVCNAGWADCDYNAANGCETNVLSSVSNCGRCGNVCSSTNGAPSCVGGTCRMACNAGYGDCDANAANGCEVDLTRDDHNCGYCGNNCTFTGKHCFQSTCI